MLVRGKWMPNITCPKCKHRHPEELSCKEAGAIAAQLRTQRNSWAADLPKELTLEDRVDALETRVKELQRQLIMLSQRGGHSNEF